MNVEELKQLLHEQNGGVLSTNILEIINSVMTLYEKGVEVGMKIGGQIKINQACEWLKGQLIDNRDNCGYPVVSTFDTTTVEEFICDFKKAMES